MALASLRARIVLWYLAVLSLTFALFGTVLYHYVDRNLQDDVNALLTSKAGGIKDSIDAFWEAEKADASRAGADPARMSKVRNANFDKIVRRWLVEKIDDPVLLNVDVRVLDADGVLIASSRKIPAAGEVTLETPVSGLDPGGRFQTVTAETAPGRTVRLRALSVPALENGRPAYVVQVISPLTSLMSTLNHLKLLLYLLFPGLVVLSGLVGIFLARITLHPVNRMINTIRGITAENLKARVTLPRTSADDEVRRLAETFNGMLDRLERSFSSQRRFVEELSHELKTPLAVLRGEIEVALKKNRTPEEYADVLRSGLEEVSRLAGLSENLLTAARYDSSTLTLEKAAVDLGRLVSEAAADMAVIAEEKSIGLYVKAADGMVTRADPSRLRRLVLNLLDNALKYTPSGGTVTVAVVPQPAGAVISVEDTGRGIPGRDLPHIFDRFYRVAEKNGAVGFGLGLTIARAIAEAHGGGIEVSSELGKGTIFSVFLPSLR
jgi:heavy metal sensor kinase